MLCHFKKRTLTPKNFGSRDSQNFGGIIFGELFRLNFSVFQLMYTEIKS